ncbi:MAG: aminoacyl-tRNA hydrolase [candidate division Zixibacteria bacterium]|nr:aminoacyl-tRNA hydrolase [candidate division Zixibacteria bacterium]
MIRLIVGLGNPGKEYLHTRHNLGFLVVDKVVDKKHGRFAEQKADYHLATLRLRSEQVYFAKPMTFMNLSGKAVATLLPRLQLLPQEMLVICDDFALPFGKVRVRLSGSDGGHNGLSSIIEHVGGDDFPRMRMGIGPQPEGVASEEFVLEKFRQEEVDILDEFIKLGVSCVETVIYRGLTDAMNKYNGL